MTSSDSKILQKIKNRKNTQSIFCTELARQLKKRDPKGYRQAVEFYLFSVMRRLPTKKEIDRAIYEDGL